MEIRNHRAVGVNYRPTPNIGRALAPVGIIVHDTGALNAAGSISWLCDPKSKVSAHFVVDRDGGVTQLAPCNVQTWHAGKSNWKGRSNCNAFTVGIEIANPGRLDRQGALYVNDIGVKVGDGEAARSKLEQRSTREHGSGWWLGYTAKQIAAVTDLCKALRAAYPAIGFIAPHWEISPGRKIDTNPLFPLSELRNSVFGVSLIPLDENTILSAQKRLKALGYHQVGEMDGLYGPATRGALLAFQADNSLPTSGVLDAVTEYALQLAPARQVSPARLIAAEAAVANRPAVKSARAAGRIVKGGLLGGGILGGLAESGALAQIEEYSGVARRLVSEGASWWAIVQPYWPLAAIAIGGVLIWQLRKIPKAEAEAYRSGEISG